MASSNAPRSPASSRARRHSRTVEVAGLDHVALPMPRGEEALARLFYGPVLGLQEVRKMSAVASRGGAWFIGPSVAIHLTPADPHDTPTGTYVALVVTSLDRARRRLAKHQVQMLEEHADQIPRRLVIADPFGNRIELVDQLDAGFTDPHRRRRR